MRKLFRSQFRITQEFGVLGNRSSFRMMKNHVCGMGTEKFKVFNTIIKSVSVNMMNNLMFFEKSSNFFFHNKSVFLYIVFSCKRMIQNMNQQIPTLFYRSVNKLRQTLTLYGAKISTWPI